MISEGWVFRRGTRGAHYVHNGAWLCSFRFQEVRAAPQRTPTESEACSVCARKVRAGVAREIISSIAVPVSVASTTPVQFSLSLLSQ